MFIQKTDWGQIAWLHTSTQNDWGHGIDVGITTIFPGKTVQHHIHYGHEQVLYILQGKGIYYIDGKAQPYQKGMHFYLPPNSKHETIPDGTEVTSELIVSNPVSFYGDMMELSISQEYPFSKIDTNILQTAIEAMKEQLMDTPFVPFTVFDTAWNMIFAGGRFSKFCNTQCHANADRKKCICLKEMKVNKEFCEKTEQFQCPYGMQIIKIRIVYQGQLLGTILGGHILLSEPKQNTENCMYVTSVATFRGIQKKLLQIADSIIKFCQFHIAREEIRQKDEILQSIQIDHNQLKINLLAAQDNVTNLRINHHFLFNTLNSMASMALSEDNTTLYDAIVDLAKMFRYTMTTDLRFMPFSAEVEYLQTYLNLQKLRHGENLDVRLSIPDTLLKVSIPFNFLQPIVENAFTHGFASKETKKKIYINAEKSENYVKISVYNNGNILDKTTLEHVRNNLKNNTGHGLSLIYEKLKSAYQGDFTMNIVSELENGTTVFITFPIKS